MPGEKKQSVQTTSTQPYKGSVKAIDQVLKDAFNTYKDGNQIYTGSTVIPFSQQTMDAQKGLMGVANQNIGTKGLNNNLQGIINNGGYSDTQNTALGSMKNQLKGLGQDGLDGRQGVVANQLQDSFKGLGRNGLTANQDNVMGRLNNTLRNIGSNGLTSSQDDMLKSLSGNYKNLGSNGLNANQDAAMRSLRQTLDRIGGNGLTGAQDQALKNFQNVANGPYDPTKSGFQDVMNSAMRDAEDQVSLGAAAAGRYGSGAHQGAVAKQTGNIAAQMRTNDFRDWQNRSDAANASVANLAQSGLGNIQSFGNQIGNLGATGFGQQSQLANQIANLSGAGLNQQAQVGNQIANLANTGIGQQQSLGGSLSNLAQTGIQNRQNLSNNLFNAGQSGLGNMLTAYQGQMNPYQTMAGVGSQMEDLATRQKNDELRIFNDTQNAPWNLYQQMLGVANLGGAYNNQATTTTSPSQNPFLTGLGVASQGVGLLGGLGLI